MNVYFLSVISFVLLIFTSVTEGSPIFDLFFGAPNGGGKRNYHRRPKGRQYNSEGYEYKKICNVVNPNPYAFIGSNPYPAVPFCPP